MGDLELTKLVINLKNSVDVFLKVLTSNNVKLHYYGGIIYFLQS